ncbi:MAG: serine hydrolase [Proteobacteria bacterium]|nr:serine hydrolase [Pseudomonadota bacterium]
MLVLAVSAAVAWVCFLRPVSPRTGPAPAAIGDGWTIATPAGEGIDAAALDRKITALLNAPLNVHGVVVERHGHLVAEYYQGGKDRSVYALFSIRRNFGPQTRQDIRSIGKSVTSLLYGIALRDGKVPAPSTAVLDAYPQLADIATTDKRRITIADLLNMASGLSWKEGSGGLNDELRLFWRKDIPRYVLGHDLATEPNTHFNYNGGGTAILADLISRGTGQPLDAYARNHLFAPMGIQDWSWVNDIHGRPMAFNGLRMRPRDLLKIGRLVLDGGRWNGRQLVPADWIAQSMAAVFATDVRDFRYGHQWWAGTVRWQGQTLDWHGGLGNGGQRLYIIPRLDMAIVTTAGAYDEDATAIRVNDLVQQIVDSVRE